MAEFKLSRIRFNWKGSWSGGQDYIVDDMVEYIGYTYVCLRTHSAGSFTNDLAGTDVTPAKPKWKKQSEGVTWTGVWTVSTDYGVGNIVKYGASIYQCTEGHTSAATFSSGTDGLVADIGKWKVVAVSSADWKYNWTINTLYRINDLVRYNGKVYKATAQHVSAANTNLGLEANQNDWEVLSDSDTWRANWAIGTRYRLNDIVKYGGYVYKCIVGHTSADNATLGLEEDQSKWEIAYDGIEYVTSTNEDTGVTSGFWQAEYRYKKNDIVKRGGNIMRCLVGHTSGDGDDAFYNDWNSNYWEIWLPGSTYDEAWADNIYYQPNDLVLYGGYIYKALTFNVGLEPSQYQGTDWNLTFEGYRFRYDWNNPGPENDSTITEQGGSVDRWINQSRLFGTITGTVTNPVLTATDSIRINNYYVTLTGTTVDSLVTDITTADIPNITATNVGGALQLTLVDIQAGEEFIKLQVAPGAGTAFADLGLKPIVHAQTIVAPIPNDYGHFGTSIKIDDTATTLVAYPFEQRRRRRLLRRPACQLRTVAVVDFEAERRAR